MKRFFPLALLLASYGDAQIENCGQFPDRINKIFSAKVTDDIEPDVRGLLDVGQNGRCFAQALSRIINTRQNKSAFAEVVQRIESSRTDKQSGAGVGGAGSTSAVSQGAVAKTLSVATEYGALTQSVSGQVVTIQGNLAGIPSALVRNNVFPYCVGEDRKNGYCVSSSMLSILRRLSFTASFDASRDSQTLNGTATGTAASGSGSAQPVTFTGQKRELTSFSARLELWNTRDETSKAFQDAWKAKVAAALDTPSADLLAAGIALVKDVGDTNWNEQWTNDSVKALIAARNDRATFVAALNQAMDNLATQATVAFEGGSVGAALAAYNRFFLAQDELIDTLAKSTVVALVYTDSRPLGQTPVNNLKLIIDKPLTTQAKLTFNGGFDFYGATPQSPNLSLSRFRDAQVGLEVDTGLMGGKSISGPATLSVAGYYQYQHSPVLLDVSGTSPLPGITFTGLPSNATTVFASTGSIWLVQAKLTLAPPGKSVKVPISVTYSNKTELIDKPTWRAQIGISYDFDSLMSILSTK